MLLIAARIGRTYTYFFLYSAAIGLCVHLLHFVSHGLGGLVMLSGISTAIAA